YRFQFLLYRRRSLLHGWICWPGAHRRKATGTHDIEAAEHVRVFHSNASGAIAAHGMAYQAPACAAWNRAVVRVNIGDHIVGDVLLKIASGDGAGVHRTTVHGLRVGQHNDHLFSALCESTFDGLRYMDFMSPLLGTDGKSMQGIDDRVATVLVLGVAGRQEHDHVAIDRITLQVPFQRFTMNLDVLYRHRLRTGNHGGHFGLHLRLQPRH